MSFIAAAGAAVGVVSGISSFFGASDKEKKAAAAQKKAKAALDAKKKEYAALDTSNLNKDMENKMEDLTINQKGMELQSQEGQQQRANIMSQMGAAAGGSGIAALAQQMAASGQLAAQKTAAMIGDQEAANQKAAAEEASSLQMKEREGEAIAQQKQMDKAGTLLGMSQQRTAAANQARSDAKAAQMGAIGDIGGAVVGGLTGGVGK